ncbi:MAG: RIP metalloprotease [Deinococcota bacterium]
MTIIIFLLILTSAVVIHELAHFFNAKSVGVPVRAFSVGMGPVLLRKQWRGTEWRLSLLPLGGYVDLPGMAAEVDEDGNLSHPQEGLATKTLWQKVWVLIGGVIANYIMAVLLLTLVTTADPSYRSLTTGQVPGESGTMFSDVVAGSAAIDLGIAPGDVVLEINGTPNPNRSQVQQAIRNDDFLELRLERAGEIVTVTSDWPPENADTPILGVSLDAINFEPLAGVNFGQALVESVGFTARIVPDTVGGFARAFGSTLTGRRSADVVGPVGIVGVVGEASQAGILPVLVVAALINFSLAIFNLLPIPGLDGGRMLLATLVAIRGKPFKPGQEEMIHFIGIAVLIVFIVLVTFGEVGELITGG